MIGLCCHYIEPRQKKNGTTEYVNIAAEKLLQLKSFKENKYSGSYVLETYRSNAANLLSVIKRVKKEGFSVYRMSSNLFPLFDLISEDIKNDSALLNTLSSIGSFVTENNMRVTFHPDQYCVLSSDSESVVANSIKILDYHAWVMDKMNLPQSPFYAINVHGGKRGNSDKLVSAIESLPQNIRGRLTLENDESCYSVSQLFDVYKRTNTPIVFDSHHHTFNDGGMPSEQAFEISCQTWSGVKPITHLSNTEPGMEKDSFMNRRKHSDYVHYIPDWQLNANNAGLIDIDFEFKMKNLAIAKAKKDFSIVV
jgi:UV DNA damage endonuclease